MKTHLLIVVTILLILSGCTTQEQTTTPSVTGVQDLLLSSQDLDQFAMTNDGCQDIIYQTINESSRTEYIMCNYTITRDNTEVIIELSKLANTSDLNGSYQYNSLHLVSSETLINENAFGDQSRFNVWVENGTYYYHLWMTKDLYLIHVTSKGTAEAGEDISNIGDAILQKFN